MSDEQTIDSSVCGACKSNVPDPAYAFPLCKNCREVLINRPFPQWIKILMILIIALLLYSSFKFPHTFNAGLANNSAKKAEAMADYSTAISEYKKILTLFPDSEEHKARLAVCYVKNGEIRQAADILIKIDDKKLSQGVVKELNALFEKVKKQNSN
ncbi:MAG: tetratricopeptide repeat protein [Nitrospirae bacterium]|nr:tetratricopeptide repeat protein [Nitrospirota bacterium]